MTSTPSSRQRTRSSTPGLPPTENRSDGQARRADACPLRRSFDVQSRGGQARADRERGEHECGEDGERRPQTRKKPRPAAPVPRSAARARRPVRPRPRPRGGGSGGSEGRAQALDLLDQEQDGPAGRPELGVGLVLGEPLSPAAQLGNLSCIHGQSMTRDQSENDSCAVRMRSSNARSMLRPLTTSATGPVRRGSRLESCGWRRFSSSRRVSATSLSADAVADAETLLREAGFEVEFPERAGLLRPARVQLGPPRGGAPGRAHVREGVLARGAGGRPLGLVRDDGRRTTCRSCSASSRSRSGSCRRSSIGPASGPPPRNEGRRVAYHDSCHMLRELQDLGPAAASARVLGRRAGAARAGGSLLRLRRDVLRSSARGLGGDGRRQARRCGRRRARS